MSFDALMSRGRGNMGAGATVRTAAPGGSSPNPNAPVGIVNETVSELGGIMEGRLTLLALDTLIIGLILFYLWTRRAQGGG